MNTSIQSGSLVAIETVWRLHLSSSPKEPQSCPWIIGIIKSLNIRIWHYCLAMSAENNGRNSIEWPPLDRLFDCARAKSTGDTNRNFILRLVNSLLKCLLSEMLHATKTTVRR